MFMGAILKYKCNICMTLSQLILILSVYPKDNAVKPRLMYKDN